MSLHKKLGECHPKLKRNQVWCRSCGGTQKVNSSRCIGGGWPKCCGHTMTIDSPEEQREFEQEKADKKFVEFQNKPPETDWLKVLGK